jgi:hypothetical protein
MRRTPQQDVFCTVIRVPCKWMCSSRLAACFAEHICGSTVRSGHDTETGRIIYHLPLPMVCFNTTSGDGFTNTATCRSVALYTLWLVYMVRIVSTVCTINTVMCHTCYYIINQWVLICAPRTPNGPPPLPTSSIYMFIYSCNGYL